MIKKLLKLKHIANILIKQKYFPYILIILLSFPACSFFFKPGLYWNMHDDMQMVRQLEMEKCIKDGQIPCRWTPDLGFGYGYPLFNFYPPMPYIVGQVFRTFQFDYMTTVKLTAIAQFILSTSFMYLLASSIFGTLGGILSALFYTYAPYHALNIYVRGAMNEAWAAVFFPLILYFSRRLILEKKYKYLFGLSISFACLLLSHNPMALIFTPVLFVWILFWMFYKYKKPFLPFLKKQIGIIIKLIFSGLFATGLAAFYTLPVIFETKFVQIKTMFEGYYHFSAHYVSIFQMFISNYWNDGGSTWGPNDTMSFMIGYAHWIISLFIIIFGIVYFFKNKKIDIKILASSLFILIGIFCAFMSHERSTFVWLIFTPIQKVQFPWRFLNLTTFFLSFSIGVLPYIIQKLFNLKNKIIYWTVTLLIVILFFTNIGYFYPVNSGPITDSQKFSGLNWERQVTSGIYDYLPNTARIAPRGPAKEFVDEIDPSESFYTISNGKKGTDWMLFDLHLSRNSKVTLAQLAFPNFKITSNGNNIPIEIEPELGRMVISLTSGDHQIMVKFVDTPIRTISNYVSLISWLYLLLFFTKPLWRQLIYKK